MVFRESETIEHLIEAYGTGMGKIMKAYEGMEEKPTIITAKNAFKIILTNINEKMKQEMLLYRKQNQPQTLLPGLKK